MSNLLKLYDSNYKIIKNIPLMMNNDNSFIIINHPIRKSYNYMREKDLVKYFDQNLINKFKKDRKKYFNKQFTKSYREDFKKEIRKIKERSIQIKENYVYN